MLPARPRRSSPLSRIVFTTFALAALVHASARTQSGAVGEFEAHGDIGAPKIAGSATYDEAQQQYTLSAGGTNMWAQRDEFHFAWKRMTGDFIIQARVELLGQGVDPHRKLGLMVRPTLDADAPYVDGMVHGDGLTSLQFRRTKGAITEQIESPLKGADVIQIERKGQTYIFSAAKFGDPFTTSEVSDVTLGDEVFVGLASVLAQWRRHRARALQGRAHRAPRERRLRAVSRLHRQRARDPRLQSGRKQVRPPLRESDRSAQLDERRQGADLQHERARRGMARTPAPFRSGHAAGHADRHRLRTTGTTTTMCCRSTARCSASATRASRAPARRSTPCRSAAARRSASRSWRRRICTAGRPTASCSIYTGGRNDEFDIYSIASDGSGSEVRPDELEGARRRARVHAGREVHLLQLRAQRPDADLADDAGRQGSGTGHQRRVQQLVPAHLARRAVDRHHQLPEGHRPDRPSVLQAASTCALMPIGGGTPKVSPTSMAGRGRSTCRRGRRTARSWRS